MSGILDAVPFSFSYVLVVIMVILVISLIMVIRGGAKAKALINNYGSGTANQLLWYIGPQFMMILILFFVDYDRLQTSFKEDPIVSFFYWNSINQDNTLFSEHYLNKHYTKPAAALAQDKKNIILIVVDALRADHMSLYDYQRKTTPFMDSLCSLGKLHKINIALAGSNNTISSLLNMLFSESITSLDQERLGVHEVLRHFDYKINFILSGVHRDWYGLDHYYGSNIDLFFEGPDSQHFDPNNDLLILEHLDKTPLFKEAGKSFFFFHLMSVHSVGTVNDRFRVFKPDKAPLFIGEEIDKKLVYTNNYDNGICQADYIIKEIFRKLSDLGYLSNTLAIITSDHGESLGGNGIFGHGNFLNQDELRIPMLIYDPDSISYENTRFATHIDIAPTILSKINVPPPGLWEGLPMNEPQSYPRFLFHHGFGGTYSLTYSDTENLIYYKRDWEHKLPVEKIYLMDRSFDQLHTKIDDSLTEIIRAKYDEKNRIYP
ncbi:sulfatase-like hydrolase/transferase [Fulvivirgaceae bacterium BMA12]|uniref:Sulfatase-like hydrolase/transferase n=1 Tax=Agaribacillus aureus TaxID=3051825 RepID=A0ABT8L2F7_9BACT|nr:sulfatase-like hydrolase/transferase [Fulvivirgaceae bacterium BMA12]